MRVNDLINIFEVFNTKVPVKWMKEQGNFVGYLQLDTNKYKIVLSPHSCGQECQFLNVSFDTLSEKGIWSQELVKIGKNASAVIGAIANAVNEKFQNVEYQFDAIVFAAHDNIEQRMRVYNYVARYYLKRFLYIIENQKLPDGSVATILISKHSELKSLTKEQIVATLTK